MPPMDADALRAMSRRAVQAWNDKDLDAYYASYHPDVVFHGPKGVELHGVDALRAQYGQALAWCPDLTITTKLLVVDADSGLVASVQDESGTAVTGEPFRFEGMTFFRVGGDGLVLEVWEQFEIRSL